MSRDGKGKRPDGRADAGTSAELFRRAWSWWPFAAYCLILFGFFLWLAWPRWWAAAGLMVFIVVAALGQRELRRRYPGAF